MKIGSIYNNSISSFIGLNCQDNKITSVKKYFIVDRDVFLTFTQQVFKLNLTLDNVDHSKEVGIKNGGCICFKHTKHKDYQAIYYKETSKQGKPYENYHLNAFEKVDNMLFFKKYFYTKNRQFINKVMTEYNIKHKNFDALEVCTGTSYRNREQSMKMAIIDEKTNFKKVSVFNKPFKNINIPNKMYIAYGKDKYNDTESHYFTNGSTWRLPEEIVYDEII
jgi:hypothetical protein